MRGGGGGGIICRDLSGEIRLGEQVVLPVKLVLLLLDCLYSWGHISFLGSLKLVSPLDKTRKFVSNHPRIVHVC